MSGDARARRVAGALIGSVVGDALGAPFEFGPPGAFSRRFPSPARGVATEMCGGRQWEPGEWTDDTQMALLVAGSLLDNGGLDEADMFDRFRRWASADPKDVGIQTSAVLHSGLPWDQAAARHFASGARAAGNGSLMRTTPASIWFAHSGRGLDHERSPPDLRTSRSTSSTSTRLVTGCSASPRTGSRPPATTGSRSHCFVSRRKA